MADQVKMRTLEGVEVDVPAALVPRKLAAGWKLFKAQDAPSPPQDIPTPGDTVTIRRPRRPH
ncbi:MAG: hypothetical protein JXQ29_18665 [Planctomycetes bacterium]|nr:hypothetical protein [Planctomycetota bacterium]